MPKEQKVCCGADVRELVCWTKGRNTETLLLRKTPSVQLTMPRTLCGWSSTLPYKKPATPWAQQDLLTRTTTGLQMFYKN